MRFTKWTQIENIQFKFTKHCDNKYSHAHQVLNTAYSNPLNSIEYLLLDDTITEVSPGSASIIKGENCNGELTCNWQQRHTTNHQPI